MKRRTADDFRRDMEAKQHSTPGDTERKERIEHNAREALRRIQGGQTYEDWRMIGQQMMVITEEVMNDLALDEWDADNKQLAREFTKRFDGWQHSVGNNIKPISKQERWALRQLMTEPKYHQFYTTELVGPEQRKTNHPNKIIEKYNRKYPDLTKPKKAKKVSNLLSPALQERDKKIADQQAYIGELEAAREAPSTLTVDQHFDALYSKLLEMPEDEARDLVNAFVAKLQKADLKRTAKAAKVKKGTKAKKPTAKKAKGKSVKTKDGEWDIQQVPLCYQPEPDELTKARAVKTKRGVRAVGSDIGSALSAAIDKLAE